MNLVVVESPAKAKTISKFLGKNYSVVASYGHIRDLPKSSFGVDIEDGFKPKYVIPKDKQPIVRELKKLTKDSDLVYIATDEDREGEAIGWHITQATKLDETKLKRIAFHEITKKAILDAIKSPRSIDMDMVNSQEARRILDRIVGYKLSPLLAKKIRKGLSAGRVQSVALKLIVDREEEIQSFKPEEYWTIHLIFENSIQADLTKAYGEKFDKLFIKKEDDKARVSKLKEEIEKESFNVYSITKTKSLRKPEPPFITSTMQMAASTYLGFSAQRTMRIAQSLYEGVDIGKERIGLITYMRTDSVNIAKEALTKVRRTIKELLGDEYLPSKPVTYKTKSKLAQEAHEAIRPTDPALLPDMVKPYLTEDQFKLYDLIWRRFVASQMKPAEFRNTKITFTSYNFEAKASYKELVFDGFLRIWTFSKLNEDKIPILKKNQSVELTEVKPKQHFTEPPPRYTEASLIKELEKHGIGRPSTYATIIDTIIKRGYVVLKDKRFYPEEIGIITSRMLDKFFSDIINVKFTAQMEDGLDKIANRELTKLELLKRFYDKFKVLLENAYENMERIKPEDEPTDEVCPLCGANLVIRHGRFGKFLACSNYPKCKYTKPLQEEITEIKCDKCGAPMVVKYSRKGSKFLACSNYPKCKNTKPYPTGLKCSECGGDLIEYSSKRGRFYGCSNYPECKFTIKGELKNQKCPKCGYSLFVKKKDKWCCANKKCNYCE
ncbi:type I DNA topoisomerase [Hippea maritima]|uniref:DNA topoisomerase 1 n=1 Tax=Hippea maritima (strain ATCC 700847 / DSM 10411 / MH2) TaxID=760142 RepID=F2LVN6_HIPMA|nr:type I DNA topoisomerase [Hippea maritima]AEA33820.1 DNA topoisomerase I [Hippea maritima DSM 10411]